MGSKSRNEKTWPCLKLPDGCPCRCHNLRARDSTRKTPARNWSHEEEELLKRGLRESRSFHEISQTFQQASIWDIRIKPRSYRSLSSKAMALGLSSRENWWSQKDLEHILAVDAGTIVLWRHLGHIVGVSRGVWWTYTKTEVKRFVRRWADVLFDPDKVRDAELRALAQTASAALRNTPVTITPRR